MTEGLCVQPGQSQVLRVQPCVAARLLQALITLGAIVPCEGYLFGNFQDHEKKEKHEVECVCVMKWLKAGGAACLGSDPGTRPPARLSSETGNKETNKTLTDAQYLPHFTE